MDMRTGEIVLLGFLLVFLGMLLIVTGTVFQAAKSTRDAEVRGGGVILLGPIPIIFGSDAESVKTVVILAVVLVVVVYLLFFRRVV
jgi:uncharacterized protein (TIGR00304 family)